jgi:hypothetical protein
MASIRFARVALMAAAVLLATSSSVADEAPASIQAASEYQDHALLEKAWALPAARRYRDGLTYQSHLSYCGSTSLVNVARSWDLDPRRVPIEAQGIALDRLAELARTRLGKQATVLRNLDLERFRKELRRSNDPSTRYIVNFARGPLFGEGGGHHSPIAGYLIEEDLVFVLDVNESYRPWLVRADRLLAAMNTMDRGVKKMRGLLRME